MGCEWACSKRMLCCSAVAVLTTIGCVALSTTCTTHGCTHRELLDSGTGKAARADDMAPTSDRFPVLSASCKLVTYGGSPTYGQWSLCDALTPSSRVLSIGIGGDASFDVDVIRRHLGARVFCFDPTISAEGFRKNLAKKSVSASELPMLRFWPFGMGREDGRTQPSKLFNGHAAKTATTFTTLRLQSLLATSSLRRADVIKFDIEGAEWDVFEHGNASRFFGARDGFAELLRTAPPTQFTLEMHGFALPGAFSGAPGDADKRVAIRQAVRMRARVTCLLSSCGYTLRHVTAHQLMCHDGRAVRAHGGALRCVRGVRRRQFAPPYGPVCATARIKVKISQQRK